MLLDTSYIVATHSKLIPPTLYSFDGTQCTFICPLSSAWTPLSLQLYWWCRQWLWLESPLLMQHLWGEKQLSLLLKHLRARYPYLRLHLHWPIERKVICYVPTWVRKITLPTFRLNAPVIIRVPWWWPEHSVETQLFSELKLVTDNLSLYLCSTQLHWSTWQYRVSDKVWMAFTRA